MSLGVSVIICCHNSAKRLLPTLAHLAAQQVVTDVLWEVIVVDNASTDDTAQLALSSWSADAPAPLRIVCEPQIGLSNARQRGFTEARYEIVSFIDDDNWVCAEWVQLASEVMSQYPDVGACGGLNEAVCEVDPPWWFEPQKGAYAIGPQGDETGKVVGDITDGRGWLWGAGLNVRKTAWQRLMKSGFTSRLSDRQGVALSSGGDTELCFALRLSGWRLRYEPRLTLCHFLPAPRLRWAYLRRLHRSYGAMTVGHDPYLAALKAQRQASETQGRQAWIWQIRYALWNLLSHRYRLINSYGASTEGDPRAIQFEYWAGRFIELIRSSINYNSSIMEVHTASWIIAK